MSTAASGAKTVKSAVLAKLFDLTEKRVEQLAKESVIVRVERGEYDLWQSIRGYITHLQKRTQGLKSEDAGDYQKHRSRLYAARADEAEITAALRKGEVHHADAVRHCMSDMLGRFRARLLALPTKVAPRVHGLPEVKSIHAEIESAIHDALAELSDYDPKPLIAHWAEAHGADVPGDGDLGAASAEADD